MAGPTNSFEKVQYDLRPAKQVERRMILEGLLLLAAAGFPISSYKYTGMGSIYFVDFMLFHKFLGIDEMLSVEYAEKARKRVAFNRPLSAIDLRFGSMSDVLTDLDDRQKHLVWLDYDARLNKDQLDDAALAAANMGDGAILLITVDVEARQSAKEDFEAYNEDLDHHFEDGWTSRDFSREAIPGLVATKLDHQIRDELQQRGGELDFQLMFNFLYADGHRMLTIGGMIVGEQTRERLLSSKLFERDYARKAVEEEPCALQVPKLTPRERILLDSNMPCEPGFVPDEFEITEKQVEQYMKVYRYLPRYTEALL